MGGGMVHPPGSKAAELTVTYTQDDREGLNRPPPPSPAKVCGWQGPRSRQSKIQMSGTGVVSLPFAGCMQAPSDGRLVGKRSQAAQPHLPCCRRPTQGVGGQNQRRGGGHGRRGFGCLFSPLWARAPARISQDYLANILLWSPQLSAG